MSVSIDPIRLYSPQINFLEADQSPPKETAWNRWILSISHCRLCNQEVLEELENHMLDRDCWYCCLNHNLKQNICRNGNKIPTIFECRQLWMSTCASRVWLHQSTTNKVDLQLSASNSAVTWNVKFAKDSKAWNMSQKKQIPSLVQPDFHQNK